MTHLRRAALAAFVMVGAHHLPANAVEPFVIGDIVIEGLQRGDPGSVFGALPFRVGDGYSDEKGAAALRALFATGLFKDVRIDIKDNTVVVAVEERPLVEKVSFVGAKEFDSDTLTKALKENGLGAGQPFDKAVLDRAEQEIKRQYLARSLYGAEVVATVSPAERNRVNITFTINEGDTAKIKDIRIVGANAVSESTLLGLMDLTSSGWLTWYTKSDRYARTKLNADLETIRSYYLNRGFLEFDIKSTQVTISPDKQDISITITINEGVPYTVTAIRLEGDYLGRDADFRDRIRFKPGESYQGDQVAATIKAFVELYGDYGYAFARVEPRTELDRAKGQVEVVLQSQPNQRVYVRRINITGNNVTRDEVIRREFRQFESAWYDGAKIRLSRDRVERLGFFGDVTIDTNEVPGAPDQVDLTLNITEKSTGSFNLSAGFSSSDKVTVSGSFKKDNIFGSGNYMGIELSLNRYARTLVLSTVEPYFTDDGISRSLDVYYKTTRPLNAIGSEYSLITPGASLRFGVPFTEYDTVFFGAGIEQTIVGTSAGVPNSYYKYVETFGKRSLTYPLTIGWAREERDNPIVPTRGRYERINLDFSPFGDVRYARLNAQYQQYFSLTPKLTLGINGEIGVGYGMNGKPYPVFKNFYGGGLGSVRGFAYGSFGSVDITGAYDGGPKRVNLNSELYFPVPGSGNDKSFRIFTFADAGNVWRAGQPMQLDDLRASAGLGLSWISPVGPLKLSWGVPVRVFPGDKIERLQFQIGTAF